jgi:hypothetical protein
VLRGSRGGIGFRQLREHLERSRSCLKPPDHVTSGKASKNVSQEAFPPSASAVLIGIRRNACRAGEAERSETAVAASRGPIRRGIIREALSEIAVAPLPSMDHTGG